MPRRVRPAVAAPVWPKATLQKDRERAIRSFRDERLKEPLEEYLEVFEEYRDAFDNLLESTVDLKELSDKALEILTDKKLLEALRYLPAPPVSFDDLKVLVQAQSLGTRALSADPELAKRIVETVLVGLDRQRFPWISEDRDATEQERASAVLASAVLIASQRVATARRNKGKEAQEERVRQSLLAAKLKEVQRRRVSTLTDAPRPGEFCMESFLGTRKADLIIGLWDKRVMPLECKVSNSETNSIKRLNNDAAVKAVAWKSDFGNTQVVPAAVLSGVFNVRNLEEAQQRGLTLFWAHDLNQLVGWIKKTKA